MYTTVVVSSEPVFAVAVGERATTACAVTFDCTADEPPLVPGPMLQLAARQEGLRRIGSWLRRLAS